MDNLDYLRFRVWDNYKKEMKYSGFVIRDGYENTGAEPLECIDSLEKSEAINKITGDESASYSLIDWSNWYGLENYIVLQCSGQKDKNNKLIYNGDIIKRQNRYIGVVIFKYGCFKIEWQDGVYYQSARHIDDYQANSLEIVGNIYENPELLEDTNNESN